MIHQLNMTRQDESANTYMKSSLIHTNLFPAFHPSFFSPVGSNAFFLAPQKLMLFWNQELVMLHERHNRLFTAQKQFTQHTSVSHELHSSFFSFLLHCRAITLQFLLVQWLKWLSECQLVNGAVFMAWGSKVCLKPDSAKLLWLALIIK